MPDDPTTGAAGSAAASTASTAGSASAAPVPAAAAVSPLKQLANDILAELKKLGPEAEADIKEALNPIVWNVVDSFEAKQGVVIRTIETHLGNPLIASVFGAAPVAA